MPLVLPGKLGKVAAVLAVAGLGAAGTYAFWHGHGGLTAGPVQDGEIGFVLTEFAYVLGPDPATSGACPYGMSKSVVDIFRESPEGARRAGESDEAYSERLEAGGTALGNAPDGRNFCQHPDIAPTDVHFRSMEQRGIRLAGLNLDGLHTPASDFIGPHGTRGIDNQFYRAMGCSASFQQNGQSNQFGSTMATGEWGILVRLTGVDDLENDDHVSVGLYANADPMSLSPTREPLRFATYALDQDKRFRAETSGRIQDGVLITNPVDVRFRSVVNSMSLERVLRDARIRAELSADGTLSGVFAGFAPVESLYDQQFGYRNGTDGAGNPAAERLKIGSSNGAARVLGYTCAGAYQALQRFADGHRDEESGRYTSISTQYRFNAVNAFLVDVDTSSANEALLGNAVPRS